MRVWIGLIVTGLVLCLTAAKCDSGVHFNGSSPAGAGTAQVAIWHGQYAPMSSTPGTWVRVNMAKSGAGGRSTVPRIWAFRKLGGVIFAIVAGTIIAHYARNAIEGVSPCPGHSGSYVAAEWSIKGKTTTMTCDELRNALNKNGPAPNTDVYDCVANTISKGSLDGLTWVYKGTKIVTRRHHVQDVVFKTDILSTVTWAECAKA